MTRNQLEQQQDTCGPTLVSKLFYLDSLTLRVICKRSPHVCRVAAPVDCGSGRLLDLWGLHFLRKFVGKLAQRRAIDAMNWEIIVLEVFLSLRSKRNN